MNHSIVPKVAQPQDSDHAALTSVFRPVASGQRDWVEASFLQRRSPAASNRGVSITRAPDQRHRMETSLLLTPGALISQGGR